MKLRVELEVSPDEVPLATELLAVLRQLTDHVKVTTTDGANGGAAAAAPHLAVPPPLPMMPGTGAAAAAATAPPSVAPQPTATPAPPATPAATANGTAAAGTATPAGPTVPPMQRLDALIRESEYSEHPEELGKQVEAIIIDPANRGPGAMFPQFLQIWKSITLDPNLPAQERSAVGFVMLLQNVSQTFKDKMRDSVVPEIMKHLTVRRPPGADRSEYYVHAEVFAALVSMGVVGLDGAIQSMCKLAQREDGLTRGAAVTMLGKTVELCHHLFQDSASPAALESMRVQVAAIKDPDFQYDVDFIQSSMGWTPGGAAASNGHPKMLHPITSCPGHSEMIFALAVDAERNQVVSGGKDSFLQVWSADGQQLQRLDLDTRYISSMDYHPKLNMLICMGLTKPSNHPLWLAGFASGQPSGFEPQGFLSRDDFVALACVKALPETTGFLTAETVAVAGQNQHNIRFWDVAASTSFQSLQPSQSFRGHSDIVTTMTRVGTEGGGFASGGKDGRVLLWDLRSAAPTGGLGTPDANGEPHRPHGSMVTTLDCTGVQLLSGGMDRAVKLWDVRSPANPLAAVSVDNTVVLKVALNASSNLAAVSGMAGLYCLDIANPSAPVLTRVEAAWGDGSKRAAYHDVKWNESQNVLYAAGKDKVVDIYALA